MEPRRLTEDRWTYTTPEQVAQLAASYYENTIQHKPDEEKKAFFLDAAKGGLDLHALWASIDYAVSVCGFGRYEIDYWPHIQEEARRIWYEMHPKAKKKKAKREEKNPPQ